MSRTFRNTSSTNKFRIKGNPMTLDKVSDSNKHRKYRCEWCISNRTISSKRQLERTDYELSLESLHEDDTL